MVHRRVVAPLVAVVLLAACGGGIDAASSTSRLSTPTTAAAEVEPRNVVAEARTQDLEVFDAPRGGAARATLDASTEASGRLVFLVKDDPGGDRIEVHLPVRPNGSTGWVRRADVDLSAHDFSVEVILGDHRLVVREQDDVVLEVAIGVGTQDTPTPGGVFYIKELLEPPDPSGPYGPYAYGLSGFSNVLDDFAGGEGVIGIHGTDDPAAVGGDVSHGCIRLRNSDITRLVHDVGLPLGTPVLIRA